MFFMITACSVRHTTIKLGPGRGVGGVIAKIFLAEFAFIPWTPLAEAGWVHTHGPSLRHCPTFLSRKFLTSIILYRLFKQVFEITKTEQQRIHPELSGSVPFIISEVLHIDS